MRRLINKKPKNPLQYTICHRPRVKKRLHMELDENGGLVVVAPGHWSKKHIEATLMQNISRVEKFLIRARNRQLSPLCYVPGEEHLYLGERFPLVIRGLSAGRSHVVFTGGEIILEVKSGEPESIQAVLHHWYQQQAKSLFRERLDVVSARADWVGDRSITLKLRRMKRTWGNCSSTGLIKLNTHLIKAPLPVIDSVIAHELCHLEVMNHSRAFYALLEGLNPNWRQDRMTLRKDGSLYLL